MAKKIQWATTCDRFRGDQLLRQYGFIIDQRPKDKPAIWKRSGETFTEQEAFQQIEMDVYLEKKKAKDKAE